MAIVISGSGTITGISEGGLPDGSVAAADIKDGAVTPAKLSTGGLNWDSSGNVGIGTSSPANLLHLEAASCEVRLKDTGASDYALIATDDNGTLSLYARDTNGIIDFRTQNTERMRIDTDATVMFSCTAFPTTTGCYIGDAHNSKTYIALAHNITGADYTYIAFQQNGVNIGSIKQNSAGTATSFNTSSDYRLKTDVQPMTGATERLKALNPVNFEWISSGTRTDGFIAHEAAEVVPEAVSGEKDAMRTEQYEVTPAVLDDDGNVVTEAVMGEREVPDYQGIDQSKLVPLLVATIQELEARIAALEAE